MKTNTSRMNKRPNVDRAVQRALMRMVEPKNFSTGAIGSATVTTGTIVPVTLPIVQGDDISQRSGDKITVRSIRLYFRFTALVASQSVRVLLFKDKFNQGTSIPTSDILPTSTWLSPLADTRQTQQKRFVILHDSKLDCNFAGEAVKSFEVVVKNVGAVYYNGATNVATSHGNGTVSLLVIGTAATGTWDFETQVQYVDA